MMFFRVLLIVGILCFAGDQMRAAESTVDFGSFVLILPDGYTNVPEKGIDSVVGSIVLKNKSFKIHYDTEGLEVGPKKLSEFSKEALDEAIYYERIEGQIPSFIYSSLYSTNPQSCSVALGIVGRGTLLFIELGSRADLQEAVSVLRAIKIGKPRS